MKNADRAAAVAARCSDLRDFTGVSAPYEAPRNPDLAIDTEHAGPEACVAGLVDYLETHARLALPGRVERRPGPHRRHRRSRP